MKKPALIASHFCLFALGAGIVYVGKGSDSANDGNGRAAAGGSGLPGGSANGTRGPGDSERTGPRGRAEGRDGGRRSDGGSTRQALDKLAAIKDPVEKQRALMDFFDRLSPGEFASVADEYQQTFHLNGQSGGMNLLFRAWAKTDPLAALDYIEANPKVAGSRGSVLETWAGADPYSAEKWALDKHTGDGPNPYMASVISGIAAHDINHASRLAQEMPLSRERGHAIDAMARALLASGVENALAFPDSISDPQLKGGFVDRIARQLGEKDPEAAANWIVSMDSGEIQNRASNHVAGILAQKNVELAKDFVASLKPEARAEAARPTVRAISNSDIPGAARWVSGLVGTPGYDRVVEEFVWSTNSRAPEQSAAWIQGIADERRQREVYHRMLGEWSRRDAAAVRAWVVENNVPADIQRRFAR